MLWHAGNKDVVGGVLSFADHAAQTGALPPSPRRPHPEPEAPSGNQLGVPELVIREVGPTEITAPAPDKRPASLPVAADVAQGGNAGNATPGGADVRPGRGDLSRAPAPAVRAKGKKRTFAQLRKGVSR